MKGQAVLSVLLLCSVVLAGCGPELAEEAGATPTPGRGPAPTPGTEEVYEGVVILLGGSALSDDLLADGRYQAAMEAGRDLLDEAMEQGMIAEGSHVTIEVMEDAELSEGGGAGALRTALIITEDPAGDYPSGTVIFEGADGLAVCYPPEGWTADVAEGNRVGWFRGPMFIEADSHVVEMIGPNAQAVETDLELDEGTLVEWAGLTDAAEAEAVDGFSSFRGAYLAIEGDRRVCLVNLETSEALLLDGSGALVQERLRYNAESGVWQLLVEEWDWVGEFYNSEPARVRFAIEGIELDGGTRIEFADPARIEALLRPIWEHYMDPAVREAVERNPDPSSADRFWMEVCQGDSFSTFLANVRAEIGSQEASIARFNQAFAPAFEAISREYGDDIQRIRTEMGLDPSLEAFAETGATIALVNHNSAEEPDAEVMGQALGFMQTIVVNGVERCFWFTIGADGGLVINIPMNRAVREASFRAYGSDIGILESNYIRSALTTLFVHIQDPDFLTGPGETPVRFLGDPDDSPLELDDVLVLGSFFEVGPESQIFVPVIGVLP